MSKYADLAKKIQKHATPNPKRHYVSPLPQPGSAARAVIALMKAQTSGVLPRQGIDPPHKLPGAFDPSKGFGDWSAVARSRGLPAQQIDNPYKPNARRVDDKLTVPPPMPPKSRPFEAASRMAPQEVEQVVDDLHSAVARLFRAVAHAMRARGFRP